MRFEWDEDKNKTNRNKHGLGFELACQIFDDPLHLSIQDRAEDGEERWQTLGLVGGVVVLLVVHTWREDDGQEVIRIISARKATKQERRRYEKNNG